ncbi:hypothetical protein ACWEV3_33185 [Saccharopolyspora sp. NPDC003752]
MSIEVWQRSTFFGWTRPGDEAGVVLPPVAGPFPAASEAWGSGRASVLVAGGAGWTFCSGAVIAWPVCAVCALCAPQAAISPAISRAPDAWSVREPKIRNRFGVTVTTSRPPASRAGSSVFALLFLKTSGRWRGCPHGRFSAVGDFVTCGAADAPVAPIDCLDQRIE